MNSEIIDYEIISTHDMNKLKTEVKTLLDQGWKLYGDLQIVAPVKDNDVEPLFTQVMVKAKL